jgi:NitT/TauT family transport system permease protein
MYSKEHKSYLKKIKFNNFLIRLTQVLILIIFIAIWQISSDKGIINSFIFSSPSKVFETIISLYQNDNLLYHIWVTVYETLIGFSLGAIIGILIASLLWANNFLFKVVDPYLTVLNSLPKIALGPIIIIWGGANATSIIIMALLISVIITIINVHQGFVHTDENKLRLMKSLGANKWQIYYKLVFPSNISNIMNAIKINISMSLIGVIMGEFLTSKAGIGHLIMYGSQVFNLNLIITGIFILCMVASIMYYGVVILEKKINSKWD